MRLLIDLLVHFQRLASLWNATPGQSFRPRRLDAACDSEFNGQGCYRVQPTKAVTGHRAPKRGRFQSEPLLLTKLLFLTILILQPVISFAIVAPQSAPQIGISGSLSAAKTQPGRTVRASVEMDIPSGYHVNSNRPLEKFLIATQLSVEAPKGILIGRVSYPRPVLRHFRFSKNRLSVYDSRATMRFNITVPGKFAPGSAEVKVRVRYQSCNDDVCFPPQTREVSLWLRVE